MKRFSIVICLMVLAFACLGDADQVFAQRGVKNRVQRLGPEGQVIPPRQKQRPNFGRRPLGGLAGANVEPDNRPFINPRIAALQKARPRLVMEALNLTPAQQAQIAQIREVQNREAPAIGRRLREAHNALERAVMGEIYNEVIIKEYTEELVAAQAEQTRMNVRMRAEIRKILTTDQVRRFIEKNREIQRQIRQIKEEELTNQINRPPNQQHQQPPDRDGEFDLLLLFQ